MHRELVTSTWIEWLSIYRAVASKQWPVSASEKDAAIFVHITLPNADQFSNTNIEQNPAALNLTLIPTLLPSQTPPCEISNNFLTHDGQRPSC